jgi:hypothetical protein
VNDSEAGMRRLGRVLAVDPRTGRAAYAFFHDNVLVDWRLRNYWRTKGLRRRVDEAIVPDLLAVIDQVNPHAVLVPQSRGDGVRSRSPHGAKIIRAVVKEAMQRGIAVHVISPKTIRAYLTKSTGEAVTCSRDAHLEILRHYPELAIVAPGRPRQKAWESERYVAPLYHAVAMFMAWRRMPTPNERRPRSVA